MLPTRATMTVVLVVVLAAGSLLATHALRVDPTGWLRWGRELAGGDAPFDTTGIPSWKPLPVLATLPLAYAGPAAASVWLVLVRASALLAIILVGRLTADRSGPLGGLVAGALLVAAPAWWPTTLGGGIEPIVVVLGCGAVAAHQARRPGLALVLVALMALGREEALLLLGAYALALVRADARRWAVPSMALGLLASGAWLGGDLAGSGRLLHGGTLALEAAHVPTPPVPTGLVVAELALAPVVGALWVAGVAAALARSDRLLLALAATGLAWAACDVALGAAGFPVPPRFLLPAAAAAAAVAGSGAAAIHRRLARSGAGQAQPAPWPSR